MGNGEFSKGDKLAKLLIEFLGKPVYINGNKTRRYILSDILQDCLRLQKYDLEGESGECIIVPFTSIISIQELDEIKGVNIFLLK